ncbi:aminotransferase class V-fold PLP-dependent enzyme [Limnofasciculus baicalensis]|uniref:Aminotransferase class V-fold PLP-dependent enzyme n=1 Tax=Limnofasciculus baicalensis BBK-W-15 TaxID=2699891 RepID=A0AAE3GRP9_9CYAN|nr:aminotransferase class V-fold PLP-dependent enzyme [Limnofasciculus baicalensis]MCP2729461.1 aminotransferase class V-fold PLP-dependent enzyme [Limnofasciculus baicalensis BBK-W-15]
MTITRSASIPIAQHRQQFPALANKAYFNFGGQGPLPMVSLNAIQKAYNHIQEQGPFSNTINNWVTVEADRTREVIASELAVPKETIALTEDVTVGCNIALWGINWQIGDRILLTDCEHPGIIATVEEIARRFGVEFSFCPIMATLNEGNPTEVILQHLTPRTRLIVLSHVLWNTGQVLPVAEIVKACRDYSTNSQPIRILVDAAQSVGCLPLNLTELGADFYAFTCHKWLCAPEGIGGFYIKPEVLEDLNPTFIGWRGIILDKAGKPIGWQPDARRFEVATSAYPLYGGVRAAIALHQEWGTSQARYEQICQLSKYLWQRLSEIKSLRCLSTSPPQSGLVSFVLTNGKSSNQLVTSLEEEGFLLRTIRDPDCIRACVHYFTDTQEIDKLVEWLMANC